MNFTNVTGDIRAIEFGLLSPNDIRGLAEVEIKVPDSIQDDGRPVPHGLQDPRMGVTSRAERCMTCRQRGGDCPGHFGYIKLATPIVHYGLVDKIYEILQSTCRMCGQVVLEQEKKERILSDLMKISQTGQRVDKFLRSNVHKECKDVDICPHCKNAHPQIEKDKPDKFRCNRERMTASEVREWLEKVPNEDLPLLGINPSACRPEWMVLTTLPVPPITARPMIELEKSNRSEDDLTHHLADILRANSKISHDRDQGSPQLIIEEATNLLQYHITMYLDNMASGNVPVTHRNGRPLKGITQRLSGKDGRFRNSLNGKRVNFSARTVISPDPNLSINEVGVPAQIARQLTVPLRVTPANFAYCQELIRRGTEPEAPKHEIYRPGVESIERPDGRKIRIIESNKEYQAENLVVGSVIERQLMDGDVVLFNRQPTLHRMSMMAHTVRVLPGKTFRFNLPCCPPYNADFDGDEMNLHILQSAESRAEAETIIKVQENIRSPRFGGSIIGAVQDHISGNFLLTWQNPKIPLEDATQVLARIGFKGQSPNIIEEKDANGERRRYVMGKDLFSTLLPNNLNLDFMSKAAASRTEAKRALGKKSITSEEYDKYLLDMDYVVKIRNGKLLSGGIDEVAISSQDGLILDTISRRYGSDAARDFLDKVTKMGNGYLSIRGITTSIDDEDIPEEAVDQIQQAADHARREVDVLLEQARSGTLNVEGGSTVLASLENQISRVTQAVKTQAGDIVADHVGMRNTTVLMAKCGARGNMGNLSSMAGLLGPQSVRGSRLQRGYQDRTLPHFKVGDRGADACGFVSHSYKQGLSPTEFFFHSMGGREGLVDTSVRTSKSGYLQRRIANALEELAVKPDGSVRDSRGRVIQFTYGEDGVDPTRSHRGKSVDFDWVFSELNAEQEVKA